MATLIPAWFDDLRHDARFSARALLRSPRFAVPVIAMLALAIGANMAVFNVADEALFRPLNVPDAERLTAVYNYDQTTGRYLDSSYPDYIDYRDHATSFEQLSAYVRFPFSVSFGDRTLHLQVEAVTPEYFQMLRLAPVIGSNFQNENGAEALISERLWREQFAQDPAAPGKTIRIERHVFTIIGVVPGRYRGANLSWSEPPDVWIPLRAVTIAVPRVEQMNVFGQRAARWLVILGRRKRDVAIAGAQAELHAIAATIASAERANSNITAVAFQASRSKFWPAFREKVTLSLGLFALAAALVLTLACANIANLLLERAQARRQEITVRLAVGASRARLVRQILIENVMLVSPGFLGAMVLSGILAALVARYPSAIGDVALALQPLDPVLDTSDTRRTARLFSRSARLLEPILSGSALVGSAHR